MTIAGWYERAGEFIARRQKDESSLTLLFRFLSPMAVEGSN